MVSALPVRLHRPGAARVLREGLSSRLAAPLTVVPRVRQRVPLDESLEVPFQHVLRQPADDLQGRAGGSGWGERRRHVRYSRRGPRAADGGAGAPGPASGPGRRGRQSAGCRQLRSRASPTPTWCCPRSSSRSSRRCGGARAQGRRLQGGGRGRWIGAGGAAVGEGASRGGRRRAPCVALLRRVHRRRRLAADLAPVCVELNLGSEGTVLRS